MSEHATREGKYIRVGDLEVCYYELGAGEPMILLHGGLATSDNMWGERPELLAQHYHVFALDSRGHGHTNNPADKLRYDQMADDVAGFIGALGLEKPLVVGYSDGAQIALELGLRHPEAAKALVIGGVVVHQSEEYKETLRSWGFAGPGEMDLDTFDPEFLQEIKTLHSDVYGPEYWRTLLPQIADLWYSVPDYSDEQLAQITTPSLVICGDRDSLDESIRLYKLLPDGELAVVPGQDHGAGDRPIFWQAIEDFISHRA